MSSAAARVFGDVSYWAGVASGLLTNAAISNIKILAAISMAHLLERVMLTLRFRVP